MSAERESVQRRLRNITSETVDQFRSNTLTFLAIYSPIVVTLGALVVLWLAVEFPAGDVFRDPIAIVDVPVYAGLISNIGALIWCGTAAICFFAYYTTRAETSPGQSSRFFLAAGLITTALLIDDFFMLHDLNDSATSVPILDLPEELFFATYCSAFVWFVWRYRHTIVSTDYIFLALALAGFGGSVFVDATDTLLPWRAVYLFEDGAKLFGIVSWSAYFIKTSARQVLARHAEMTVVHIHRDHAPQRQEMYR